MDGQYRPLRLLQDGRAAPPVRSGFSSGAAYLTRLALSQRERPDAPPRPGPRLSTQPIAWKTGTSFGYHDAWAAGIGERYTAVVWVGNFDGKASKALVGADAAAPILFDLLSALQPQTPPPPQAPPKDVGSVEVCAYSGYPPGAACAERRQVSGLPSSVPTTTCPYHREIEVDEKSGLALSASCRGRYTPVKRRMLVWPARLRRWLADSGQGPGEPPRYAPGCAPPGHPPIITSPPAGQGVLLIPGLPPAAQRVPLAADSDGSSTISWFVDGEYLGTYPAQERAYYTPAEGSHRIVATDEAGVSAERSLNVRALR